MARHRCLFRSVASVSVRAVVTVSNKLVNNDTIKSAFLQVKFLIYCG